MSINVIYSVIGFSAILALFYFVYGDDRKKVMGRLLKRRNAESDWLGAEVKIEIVEDLLTIICNEFDFDMDLRYRILPDDTLMTVYGIEYPKTPMADCMELETVIARIEKTYSTGFGEWDKSDLTLLEIAKIMEEAKQRL